MEELPNGWVRTQLGQVAEINPRRSVSLAHDTLVSFVPMAAVDEATGTIAAPTIRPYREVARGYTQFQEGDVLFAKITPSMENGKSAVASELKNSVGFGSTEFHVLRASGAIDPVFIWHFVRQKSFREAAQKTMTGAVGQQRVPANFLKGYEIFLPPLAEQKRIVAKIENLLARVERTQAELRRAEELADLFRLRVLEQTFADLREAADFGSLLDGIKAGKNLRCAERPPSASEKGVVKVSAVTWGEFNAAESKTLPSAFVPPDDTLIRNGDFLFSRANTVELVGAVVIVKDAPHNLYLSDKILRLEMDSALKPWILWYFRSPDGRQQLMEASSGNQFSMRNISQSSLKNIKIPVADFQEMSKRLGKLISSFARADSTALQIDESTEHLEQIKQKIIAKAFRGELCPQDPNDESASILLERISEYKVGHMVEISNKSARQSEKSMKQETRALETVLQQFSESGVTFEQLMASLPESYEQVRLQLFELMSGPNPIIMQFFDENERTMKLRKVA